MQLDFATSLVDTDGYLLTQIANLNQNNITTTINNLFLDPDENYDQIAPYMEALYKKNGIVGGTIRYLESHLTYNHSIYPTMNSKSGYVMNGDGEEYGEVAEEIDSYNIKFYAPYFIKKTLINGVSFFYEVKDKKGVAYIEFPTEWGRVYEINSGIYKWELDISKLDTNTTGLPSEIQTALDNYESGNTSDEKKWVDNKWYKLSDKGIAFSLDQNVLRSGAQVSELSNILLDTVTLENAKKNVEVLDTIDSVRLLHSKIPTDSNGKPLMSSKTARVYDRQFKNSLPKGIAGITSPMEISNVSLNGSGNQSSYKMIESAQKQLFLATGTPSNLFGESSTSSNIVKMSIQKDANWLYTSALPMLENYYNYKLSKFRTKSNMVWKIKFIRQSYFTMKEDVSALKDQLSMGGSRLDYLASTGMTPIEVFGKLKMEQQMLDIDSFMLPKQTSFTMSDSDTGRPTTDEPTDDTVRISDSA